MKKTFLTLALAGICALTAGAQKTPYEFYVIKADGNIITVANSKVDHIEIVKADDGKTYLHQFHLADGTVDSYPQADIKEVILNDIITDSDSITDLGLSVDWRTCNLGAGTSADYGDLVGWGDPTGKHHEQYHTSSYGAYNKNKNSCLEYYGGITPPDSICGTELDIATTMLGADWRMPTLAEAQELIDKCDWMWMEYRGAQGVRVTGPNGNSIFLPAGGMRRGETMTSHENEYGGYWTASWYGTSNSTSAMKGEMSWAMTFGILNGGFYKPNAVYRYSGLLIRPVAAKRQATEE